jgi:hypothetical protein
MPGSVPSGAPGWCRVVLAASAVKIPGHARLCAERRARLVSGRARRVGREDPGPCPPLCRAVRPMRRIGGQARGWAPQNLARSPRSGALKIFHMFCVLTSCQGSLLRKRDWRTFISVHFSETWVTPSHTWLLLPPLQPALTHQGTNKTAWGPTEHTHRIGTGSVYVPASDGVILGPARLCAEQCARRAGLAVGSEGGHLRIWRAAPGRAH